MDGPKKGFEFAADAPGERSGFVETCNPHTALSQRERAFGSGLPWPPINHRRQRGHNQRDNHDGEAISAPANATLKGRIQPHSEFIKRETDAKTVKQGNPQCGSMALEDQCQVAGSGKNEDAVYVVMNVQPGYWFPMHPRQDQAKEAGTGRRQDKCGCDTHSRTLRFQQRHIVALYQATRRPRGARPIRVVRIS